jgi:hypothetical protein
MTAKKRRGSSDNPITGCDSIIPATFGKEVPQEFVKKVLRVLAEQDVVVPIDEQKRFIEHLSRSIQLRRINAARWSRNRQTDDMIGLIQMARDSGDLDEAVWRSFLVAHFGGASLEAKPLQSAHDFLCAFGAEPVWTWQRVCGAPDAFRRWLSEHAVDLKSLFFGNHRKYESKKPRAVWAVI